jgi:hypothetical protein
MQLMQLQQQNEYYQTDNQQKVQIPLFFEVESEIVELSYYLLNIQNEVSVRKILQYKNLDELIKLGLLKSDNQLLKEKLVEGL